MRDLTGIECDNCALCISHCHPKALSFSFGISDPPSRGPGLAKPATQDIAIPEADRENGSDLEKSNAGLAPVENGIGA